MADDPPWQRRGLLLLRVFLGATFTFAALQKVSDPAFTDPTAAGSLAAQLTALAPASPLGPLLRAVTPYAAVLAWSVAAAELAVGLATLAGLWSRLAAIGGAALSLLFWLTVSWRTRPYYYAPDPVFAVAWLTLALAAPISPALDLSRAGPGLRADSGAGTGAGSGSRALPEKPGRRRTLRWGAAALLALVGGTLAAAAGWSGRRGPTDTGRTAGTAAGSAAGPDPTAGPGPTTGPAPTAGDLQPVARLADLPVGQPVAFHDPGTDRQAYLTRTGADQVRALSAVCTHALCTVEWQAPQRQFFCPCHGSLFDPSGAVLRGPATAPLPPVAVELRGAQVVVQVVPGPGSPSGG